MTDTEYRLRLDQISEGRFTIVAYDPATDKKRWVISGPDALGYTEDDLRSEDGLPKLGLSVEKINEAITRARNKV
jgi:hypothetical protein